LEWSLNGGGYFTHHYFCGGLINSNFEGLVANIFFNHKFLKVLFCFVLFALLWLGFALLSPHASFLFSFLSFDSLDIIDF
jgi:hypothetical protein